MNGNRINTDRETNEKKFVRIKYGNSQSECDWCEWILMQTVESKDFLVH